MLAHERTIPDRCRAPPPRTCPAAAHQWMKGLQIAPASTHTDRSNETHRQIDCRAVAIALAYCKPMRKVGSKTHMSGQRRDDDHGAAESVERLWQIYADQIGIPHAEPASSSELAPRPGERPVRPVAVTAARVGGLLAAVAVVVVALMAGIAFWHRFSTSATDDPLCRPTSRSDARRRCPPSRRPPRQRQRREDHRRAQR